MKLNANDGWKLVAKAVKKSRGFYHSIYATNNLLIKYKIGELRTALHKYLPLWVIPIHNGHHMFAPGAMFDCIFICAARNIGIRETKSGSGIFTNSMKKIEERFKTNDLIWSNEARY